MKSRRKDVFEIRERHGGSRRSQEKVMELVARFYCYFLEARTGVGCSSSLLQFAVVSRQCAFYAHAPPRRTALAITYVEHVVHTADYI